MQVYSTDKIYMGKLLAVDKFMNIVLMQTTEADINGDSSLSRDLGMIFLRGEQI